MVLVAADGIVALAFIGVEAFAGASAWIVLSAIGHAWRHSAVQRLVHPGASSASSKPFRTLSSDSSASGLLSGAKSMLVGAFFVQPAIEPYAFVIALVGLVGCSLFASSARPLIFLPWALPMATMFGAALLLQPRSDRLMAVSLFAGLVVLMVAHFREQRFLTESMLRLLQRRDQIAQALRAERDMATESSASKTRFFAAASHDLRQPLHALSINATTLQLVAGKQTDPVIRTLSLSINKALQRSNGLLDSLLDLSRLDSNAVDLNIESVSAVALLTAVADQFQPSADERGLALSVEQLGTGPEVNLTISTDVGLMLRVLGNLVSNAIKFTSSGGVRLTAQPDEVGGSNNVVLQIADSGRGIAAGDLKRVFDEFYQAGTPQRDADGGLGLGLSIVKRATDLMGVAVDIHSIVGEGTVVTLKVPMASGSSSTPQAPETAPQTLSHVGTGSDIRALLVEDEKEICDSMQGFLPHLGYEIRSASNTIEALALVERGFIPTVLVIDQLLRFETGLLVTHRLWRVLGRIPAVMITGDTNPATMELAIASGMRVVHKPVDGLRLIQILREVQGGTRQPDASTPPTE